MPRKGDIRYNDLKGHFQVWGVPIAAAVSLFPVPGWWKPQALGINPQNVERAVAAGFSNMRDWRKAARRGEISSRMTRPRAGLPDAGQLSHLTGGKGALATFTGAGKKTGGVPSVPGGFGIGSDERYAPSGEYGEGYASVNPGYNGMNWGDEFAIGPAMTGIMGSVRNLLEQQARENVLQAEAAVPVYGAVQKISQDGYTVTTIDSYWHIANSPPSTNIGSGEWSKSLLLKGAVGDSFVLVRNPLVNGVNNWDSSDNSPASTFTFDGAPRVITIGQEQQAIVDLHEVTGAPNGTTTWAIHAEQTGSEAFASFYQRPGSWPDLIIGKRS